MPDQGATGFGVPQVAQDMAWWSADGKSVHFIAGRRDRSAFSLCVADATDGSCRTLLTETSDTL